MLIYYLWDGKGEPQSQGSELGWRTDELPPYEDIIDDAMKSTAERFASDFCGETL